MQAAHLDAEQGRFEQRIEPYMQYGERVAENLTQLCAKSISRVDSSAGEQADAVRGLQ